MVGDGVHKDERGGGKYASLTRQWHLLKELSAAQRVCTAAELCQRLDAQGIIACKRTVERDLNALSSLFAIESDQRSKPYGWRWQRHASPFDVEGMSKVQAVALLTAQAHLEGLLPANLADQLAPLYITARKTLANRPDNRWTEHWPKRVSRIAPSQPLIAPEIQHDVLTAVHQALLEQRQLAIEYTRRGADTARQHCINPVSLIQRGPVAYLAAHIDGKSELSLFALHRIGNAELLEKKIPAASDSALEQARAHVSAGFDQGPPITLCLHLRHYLAQHLLEAPLSADQHAESHDEHWTALTATVDDTAQLRWWLLGMGAGVKVIAPKALADEIRQQHREAANA